MPNIPLEAFVRLELCPDQPCIPLPSASLDDVLWRLRDPIDPGVFLRRQAADMLEAYQRRES